jgi:hypothetical protein
VNHGVRLIVFPWQALEVKAPICALAVQRFRGLWLIGRFHLIRADSRPLLPDEKVAADISRLILFPGDFMRVSR